MWDKALKAVYADREFEYGVWDCCQFVRAYVRQLTGVDHGANLAYVGEKEANAILDKYGGLIGFLSHFLGEPDPNPQPGDVVVVDAAVPASGVFCGQWSLVLSVDGMARTTAPVLASWSCHKQ